MTVFWICSSIAVTAGAFAAFVGDLRRAVLSLWIASLAVGGVYLSLNAELLAVVQWIASTLVAISFMFYAVMFGEYGASEDGPVPRSRRMLPIILPLLLGVGFCGTLWVGASNFAKAKPGSGMFQQSVSTIGTALAQDHMLSLEILALTLFIVIVGSGAIARPDAKGGPSR